MMEPRNLETKQIGGTPIKRNGMLSLVPKLYIPVVPHKAVAEVSKIGNL